MEKMNELEKVLSDMLDEYGQDPDKMKDSVIEKYTKSIRHAIASEIDVDAMVKKRITVRSAYRKGIEDTLKAIQRMMTDCYCGEDFKIDLEED